MGEPTVLEYTREKPTQPAGLGFLVRAWPGAMAAAIILCRGGYVLKRGFGNLSTLNQVHFSIELAVAVPLVVSAIVPRPRLMFGAVVVLAAVTFAYLRGFLGDWVSWGNFRSEAKDLYCLFVAGWVLGGYRGGRWERNRSAALVLCGIGVLAVGANTLAFYTYNLAYNWARGYLFSLSLVPDITYCGAAALLVAGGVGTLWRIRGAARVAWFAMLAWVGMFELESNCPGIFHAGARTQLWGPLQISDLYTLANHLGQVVVAWGAMAAVQEGESRR